MEKWDHIFNLHLEGVGIKWGILWKSIFAKYNAYQLLSQDCKSFTLNALKCVRACVCEEERERVDIESSLF